MKIRRFLALVLSVLMVSSSVVPTSSVNALASSAPVISETDDAGEAENIEEGAADEAEGSEDAEAADEAEDPEDAEAEGEAEDSENANEAEESEDSELEGEEEEELEELEAEGEIEEPEEETSDINYVTKPAATAAGNGAAVSTEEAEEEASEGTDITDRVLTDEMTGRDADAEAEAEARKEELEARFLDEETAQALVNGADTSDVEESESTGSTGTGTVSSDSTGTIGNLTVEEVDRDEIDADLTKSGSDQTVLSNETTWDDEDMVKVIIEFQGDSVIEANSDADPESAYAAYKIRLLERKQAAAVAEIEEEVLDGEELTVTYQYTWAINAVAAEVPYGTLDEIEALSSVDKVYIQEMYSVPETGDETLTTGSAEMTGKYDAWTAGYTGKGIKIAIIDTGIDSDHQSFAALGEDALTSDSATVQTIAGVLDKLNAYQRYLSLYNKELTADDLYYTTKIAYGFNYCDDSLDITHDNDEQGDHGTHVAGIATANEVEGSNVTGMAPDAQLYVMKVFGQNGGAFSEDIIAALEDAMILGADVVNMSLGSSAGFSESGDEAIDKVYANVAETKTVLLVSAGNSGTFGDDNLIGGSLTSNPDNGVVSSPSTYANAISVASVDNAAITAYYVETTDGTKLAYDEGSNGGNDAMSTLYGQTLEYVMIDGYGEEEDYADVDVTGKIAVVERGSISFYVKLDNAANAGAVGILVYNNVSGSISADLSGASGTIPFASISMAAGEQLQSLYDEALANGEAATLYFSDEMSLVSNDTAYEMSYFSSWGSDGALRIEPDVTAPGGSIYSTLTDGEYGLMSGTSMSSPQVAGISALLQQYVRSEYPDLSDIEARQLVTALLLSTASPLDYDEDTYYSVRQQGSGLANAYDAITTDAYLTVDGSDEPQAEVGDNENGVYTYDFNIVNIGDSTLYYDITTTAQTEDYTADEESSLTYMATTPINLEAETTATGSAIVLTYDYDESGATHSHDARQAYINLENIDAAEQFRYDLDGDEDVDEDDVQAYLDALVDKNTDVDLTSQVAKVDAGETASVHVTVMVSEEGKAWMDEHFENGIYVEGFTVLTAKSAGSVDLSIPYLGFYGTWSEAPMIDSGYYYMSDDELEASNMSQYYNVLFSNAGGYDDNWEPGFNPYVDEDFDVAHISLSPNGDGYVDYISDVYVSLLRNAEHLTLTFSNLEDETEVYSETIVDKVNKSYYYSGYGLCLPFIYSWYASGYCFDGTDGNGNALENNTQVQMTIYADLGYDDLGQTENNTWKEIITIDTEVPTLDMDEEKTYITINEDGTQTLTLTFKDNVDGAAVNFLSKSSVVKAQYAVEHPETKGEYVTATYDIAGFGNTFYVVLGDYALNESAYMFTTTDNIPEVDESLLYGYRAYDEKYTDATFYGWVSMNTDEENFESAVVDSEYYMDYAINAAAYVDGYVMAVAGDNKLYAIVPGLWDEWIYVADLNTSINSMTYDPVNQCLWAYSDANYALCKIDVLTGELTQVGDSYSLSGVLALASDDNGILYAMVHTYSADSLRTINTETGLLTAEGEENYLNYAGLNADMVAISGLGSVNFGYAMSMVYDAADDCLYWAAFSQSSYWGNYGGLIRLEPDFDNNTVTLTEIGIIEGNAEIVGLLKLEDRGESIIPDDAAVTGLDIEESSVALLVDGSDSLTVNYTPWYAQPDGDLVWTSADETIATVNYYGVVTGVSVGETTITVSTADGSFSDSCAVKVLDPAAELYGYVLYGYNGLSYQWASFSGDAPSDFTVLTDSSALVWTAAEYYDGSVYAFDSNNDLYQIDPETYEMVKLGSLGDYFYGNSVYDMAYDYSTGFMYILDDYGYLYRVDMMTAMTEYVGYLADSYGAVALTLAISTEGTIYFITGNGFLCSYDVDAWECTDIGPLGTYVYTYYQSMTYDHNGGGIYWAAIDGLYYVDPDTGSALYLGNVNGVMTQITGLYTVIDEIPERPYVEVDYMYATAYSVFLLEGMTTEIPVQVYPFNATERTITWEIADESVVQISGNSLVGVSVGSTTVTGTLGDYSVTIDITVKPSTGTLNAYLLYDMSAGGAYSWITFEDNDASSSVNVVNGSTEFTVYAGEYYNGKIYVSGHQMDENFNTSAVFAVLDAQTYETELYVASDTLPYANDMAFDYSTGTLYAVGGQSNSDTTYLYMVDTKTGTYYQIAQTEEYLLGLACSTDGVLYALDEYGCFYQVDKATAELTYIGYTGYGSNMLQSMAYDHDTGNLYWAQCNQEWSGTVECNFMLIDQATGAASVIGTIGSAGGQAVALFSIPENEIEIASTEPTGISFNTSSAVLYVGDTLQLSAGFTPISVVEYEGTITYASSDPSVASVDENGLVTALTKGSAVITASCGEISGTCQIAVTDDSVIFYAFDAEGVYTAPVYAPADTTNYVWLDDSAIIGDTEFAYVAYSSADGLYYALDTDDNLWSFAYDGNSFSQEQQITTDSPIVGDAVTKALEGEEVDESTVYYGSLIDLTMNDYTNTLYVMLEIGIYYQSMNYYYAQHYYIYAVDTSTGELTLEANIQWAAGTPQAFTFVAADRIVWFDSVNDYVMAQQFSFISDDDDLDSSLKQLAWVQNDFTAVGKLAMVYSDTMNRAYMAAWHDGYYTGEYFYGLFEFDLGTNQISLIGEAAYWDAIDLVLFE
ncbi:MAG: S8 family serine peptidase [Lachnospiraceae bacterium]|nr:S8 family serine peptidase [Lachnospiraceae bacterium]